MNDARLKQLIEPVVINHGFALVRMQMQGGQKAPTLQVMAEDPATGQMTLDQCAKLSRALSALLDEADPIEHEYRLEVSSPGIDRPLTRPADWTRWAGHAARVELAEPDAAGRKRYTGKLLGLDGDAGVLDADGLGEVRLPLDAVKAAKLVLTDALIAATVPLTTEGADEIEEVADAANDDMTEERD